MKLKLEKIKVLVLDVDGVLTDGRIIVDDAGKELKNFDVKDGFGLVLLMKKGLKTAIISARHSKAVMARAKDLKIHKVYQDAYPKTEAYEALLKYFKVSDDEVCFVGDDLPDVPVLKRVGFAVTVPNSPVEVKGVCDYVTKNEGGKGAVREIVELILKNQNKWDIV